MLEETRFAPHFEVFGNRERHFGLFDCSEPKPAETSAGCC
jgi:hypothetical protein